MKQEYKELLLKDLCGRLPYNVAIDCRDEDSRFTCYLTTDILNEIQNNTYHWEYKPYLFPLSTLTEELKTFIRWKLTLPFYETFDEESLEDLLNNNIQVVNFCYENHIDINGLIEKGLAIDATGKNIY